MIELIATAESVAQAKALLTSGVDTIYIGEDAFALRMPASFSRNEQREIVAFAHEMGKKVAVAVNAIMHPEKMKKIPEYLAFLAEVQPDFLVVGDTGVIYLLRKGAYDLPFVYDGETLVTNARQINFWQKKGAIGAVLAREVPFEEMQRLIQKVDVPIEVLVYGATCIHQSKRPLVENYFHFTQQDADSSRARGLFLAEPKKPETHYSIYEDQHGTHIFADNDLQLVHELQELADTGYTTWKLDGLYSPGENFVAIARLFVEAKQAIEAGTWTKSLADEMLEKVRALHPTARGLDTGFYHIDAEAIK